MADDLLQPSGEIVLFQTEDGRTRLQVRLEAETVWLSQAQMAELFQTTKQNISFHIQNIYEENELRQDRTVKEYLTVQSEGSREVKRNIEFYNLDAILSVPGIDMVQFGPSDYSMSIGRAGEYSHPDVRKAEQKTIETALKKGIHPRAEISEPSEAARYLEMGVKHFCIGWDVDILHSYWRTRGQAMQDLLVAPAKQSSKAGRQTAGGGSYRQAKAAKKP